MRSGKHSTGELGEDLPELRGGFGRGGRLLIDHADLDLPHRDVDASEVASSSACRIRSRT